METGRAALVRAIEVTRFRTRVHDAPDVGEATVAMGGRAGMVVVGIDGSAPSRTALRYALAEAYRRGAGVRLVWAYDPSEPRPTGADTPPRFIDPTAELSARARRMAAGLAKADPRLASVPVEIRVLAGQAAGVLLAAARDADLVVIGRRGRAGLAKALLGPVRLHFLQEEENYFTLSEQTSPPRRVIDGGNP
jgi:nucleotide-binding universal stress UspA family protein